MAKDLLFLLVVGVSEEEEVAGELTINMDEDADGEEPVLGRGRDGGGDRGGGGGTRRLRRMVCSLWKRGRAERICLYKI